MKSNHLLVIHDQISSSDQLICVLCVFKSNESESFGATRFPVYHDSCIYNLAVGSKERLH